MTGRLVVLLFLLLGDALAQFSTGSVAMTGRVRVQIWFADHAACDPSTFVALIANNGFTFDSAVDGHCVADFFDVPAGNYRVKVTGADVASADNADFALSPGMTQDLEVRARHTGGFEAQGLAAAAFVSVSDFSVPATARKEFEKANRLISKRDWVRQKNGWVKQSRCIRCMPPLTTTWALSTLTWEKLGGLARRCRRPFLSMDIWR